MKLFLVQHGEACAKDVDPERPLTERGKADVARLADFLLKAGVQAEQVIHSGKLRARQTAERLADAIAPGVTLTESGLINPKDNPKAFDWQGECWGRETLDVGHLPFMARLVSYLVTGDEDRPISAFQPGTVICLEHDGDARWLVAWMIRPDLLRSAV